MFSSVSVEDTARQIGQRVKHMHRINSLSVGNLQLDLQSQSVPLEALARGEITNRHRVDRECGNREEGRYYSVCSWVESCPTQISSLRCVCAEKQAITTRGKADGDRGLSSAN